MVRHRDFGHWDLRPLTLPQNLRLEIVGCLTERES